MSNWNFDYSAVFKKAERVRKLQNAMNALQERHIGKLVPDVDQAFKRYSLQMMILSKMYAQAVIDAHEAFLYLQRKIERDVLKGVSWDPELAGWVKTEAAHYGKLVENYHIWLFRAGDVLDRYKVTFTANELKTAFSMPDQKWNQVMKSA